MSARDLFEIPREVAYLNCGYMAPLLRSVRAAGERGVAVKSTPWTMSRDDFFDDSERLRGLFAELVGCDAEGVALAPSASYGLDTVAANTPLKAGQKVVVLAEQFPSNVYPWRHLCTKHGGELVTVPRPDDDDWTAAVLARLDDGVALAALPHCHWTDGGKLDLVRVAEALRGRGAKLVLDLTQSLGALPFDFAAVQPDAIVAAAYKWLLGPYSQAFLYVSERYREGEPIEHNWITRAHSEDFAGLVAYRDAYQPGARRFDVGERSNFVLVPMAIAALEQLLEWGIGTVQAHASALAKRIVDETAELGLQPVADEHRAGHYLGLRFADAVPADLAARLAAEQVYVSVRGKSVRVTPHLYNDDQDVARFVAALRAALKR